MCHPPRLARGLSSPAGVEPLAAVVESFRLADSVPASVSYDVPVWITVRRVTFLATFPPGKKKEKVRASERGPFTGGQGTLLTVLWSLVLSWGDEGYPSLWSQV